MKTANEVNAPKASKSSKNEGACTRCLSIDAPKPILLVEKYVPKPFALVLQLIIAVPYAVKAATIQLWQLAAGAKVAK